NPDDLSGHLQLAVLAMQQSDWPKALERWDALLARFGEDERADNWKLARANALRSLGRGDEAEAELRSLRSRTPTSVPILSGLLSHLILAGRSGEALELIEASGAPGDEVAILAGTKIEALIRRKRLGEARAVFTGVLQGPTAVSTLEKLFNHAAPLF